MMAGIRTGLVGLRNLPPEAQDAIDAWDPDHQAMAVVDLFASHEPIGDRPVFGPRLPEWQALEDKTIIDAFWDAADVPRAASAVVPVAQAAAVAPSIDQGDGTVWVADNRDGWHGGASMLRWVRSDDEAAEATQALGRHADRVRVMPFLEGIPLAPSTASCCRCAPGRDGGPAQAGLARAAVPPAAPFWDPEPADREEMRSIARRVGARLAATVSYRGCFTVDGVMTGDGFRPTELNPRFGAGLGTVNKGLKEPRSTCSTWR